MTDREVEYFLFNTKIFKYKSYDHKKAVEDYKKTFPENYDWSYKPNIDCFEIPDEIKEKYIIMKKGKLRAIYFSNNGVFLKCKIGSKYAKTFYSEDFDKSVFPIK